MQKHALPDFQFDGMSEADIREEVIAPVLRMLGYQSGTDNNVVREKSISLRYPNMFLGRKKIGKDPVLRGRPDYICEVRNVTRWAIEAKPPSEEIDRNDIEQAHSYAAHPELAAPLFVLTNGRSWKIFESNRGPAATPLIALTYTELQNDFYKLENLLSPPSLRRNYPVRVLDLHRPLSAGTGSRVAIVGGFTRYDQLDLIVEGLPAEIVQPAIDRAQRLVGYATTITGAECYRDPEMGIVANVKMHHPNEIMSKFASENGFATQQYVTRADSISNEPTSPTIFETSSSRKLAPGTRTFDIIQWAEMIVPCPMDVAWYAEAIGYLASERHFQGTYSARLMSKMFFPGLTVVQHTFMRGSFQIDFRHD